MKISDQSGKPAENLTPEEIDSHVAGMTDERIRQAYAEKLKQDASARTSATAQTSGKGTWQDVSAQFYGVARSAKAGLKRAGNFISGETQSEGQWQDVIAKLTHGKGGGHLLLTLIGLIVIIALGLITRWLFRRGTADILDTILNAVQLGKLQFLGRVLSRMLLDALGVGINMLTTFILFVLFYQEETPSYIIVSVFLIVSYYIMVLAFGAKVIFSPKVASLRLFPMEDQDATFLYRLMMPSGSATLSNAAAPRGWWNTYPCVP